MLKVKLVPTLRSTFGRSLLFASFLSACAAQEPAATDDDATAQPVTGGPGVGTVEVRLVDAPNNDVTEIVVTITKVTAHVAGGGGWIVLGNTTGTIDLLKLQGGSFAQLGVAKMPSGRVTQLRLYVKEDGPNYVTTPDGVHHPLTVPSGPQSGIKLKGGFDWPACGVGNLTIDFDGKKSIFVHPKGAGAGDEWLLRPVVRLKSVTVSGDGCAPDGGTTPPSEQPVDAGMPVGMMPAPDGGITMPPVMTPPPGDSCAAVTCGDGLICYNGNCVQPVD